MNASDPDFSGAAAPMILVVDDDAGQRSLLESFLCRHKFLVTTASSGEHALEVFHGKGRRIDMMITDVRMTGMSGLETLRRVRELRPEIPILLVTAYADVRDAVHAMRDGAVNYLEKPIDLDELLANVRQALGLRRPASGDADPTPPAPPGVIALSAPMRAVIREISFVAPSHSRVLITGESGVGKEVIADLIHAQSPRARGPLVKVNCAAIPESLLESELFGHEKGSFTGATSSRVGRFEEANGGTILLDEIGEMPLALQAKLLRVTQDGSYQRIGSGGTRMTDARILASTNRDLEKDVAAGRFREDLFFRLNVVEIFAPPLRERREDIMALANLFASQFSGGRPRFSPASVALLERYSWPGNVRELRNAMERALLMARGELILPEHLPRRIQAQPAAGELPGEALAGAGAGAASPQAAATATGTAGATGPAGGKMEEVERALILQTLRANRHNRSETARALGLSRRALLYKLQRYRELGLMGEEE